MYLNKLIVLIFLVLVRGQIECIKKGKISLNETTIQKSLNKTSILFVNISSLQQVQFSQLNVICIINNVKMLNTISLEFNCTLIENQLKIKIMFHKIPQKYKQFQMDIDYLIGKNMITDDLKMTTYQQHLMADKLPLPGNNKSKNRHQHHQILLILNGFSNISLSTHITYSFIRLPNMYTVHYMTNKGQDSQMGWNQTTDFLLFKILFIQKFPFDQQKYAVQMKYHLTDSFTYSYDSQQIELFYGLTGFEGQDINIMVNQQQKEIKFNPIKINKQYQIIIFPFNKNIKKSHQSRYYLLILIIILLITTFLFYQLVKYLYKKYFKKQKNDDFHQTSICQIKQVSTFQDAKGDQIEINQIQ